MPLFSGGAYLVSSPVAHNILRHINVLSSVKEANPSRVKINILEDFKNASPILNPQYLLDRI